MKSEDPNEPLNPNLKCQKCRYLVLSSGGIKSFCFLNKLKSMEDNGCLSDLHAISGSSAGSAIGFLLCIHPVSFIFNELKQSDILPLFRKEHVKLSSLFSHYGLNNCNHIESTLRNVLFKWKSIHNISFKDFFELTNIHFFVNASNMNTQKTEYFSHFTTPDTDVVTALLMSMCIPFYFTPIKHNDFFYNDGAILDTAPISPFFTFFKIKNKKEIFVFLNSEDTLSSNVTNIFDYIFFFINSLRLFLQNRNNLLCMKNDINIITIQNCHVPMLSHSFTKDEYIDLLDNPLPISD